MNTDNPDSETYIEEYLDDLQRAQNSLSINKIHEFH